jgi:hypothetical protein
MRKFQLDPFNGLGGVITCGQTDVQSEKNISANFLADITLASIHKVYQMLLLELM